VRPSQISTTNPVEKCNKIYRQKRDLFWEASGCVAAYAEYSSTPKGVLEYPLWVPTQWKHMGDNANWRSPQCDSGSAVWSLTPPTRSDLRTSQHRRQRGPQTRIFSPQLILVCRRPRCRKREKWQGMHPSILTIDRTETTGRADFGVHLTRRDRRTPVMMLCMRVAASRAIIDIRCGI